VSLRICAESGIRSLRQERKQRLRFWRDDATRLRQKGGDGGRIL